MATSVSAEGVATGDDTSGGLVQPPEAIPRHLEAAISRILGSVRCTGPGVAKDVKKHVKRWKPLKNKTLK